ncbi:hypothetical protein FOA52_009552 [Chlamydomonas sp. UWO 241]|nr:hypothetical protein FOA52_009552 [Chlamydomonas sp. UWO 241]
METRPSSRLLACRNNGDIPASNRLHRPSDCTSEERYGNTRQQRGCTGAHLYLSYI